MADEHTNDGGKNSDSSNPGTGATVENNAKDIKQEDGQTGDKSKDCNNKKEIPQPLRIKVDKEKRTWKDWERTEIISGVAAILSAVSIGVAAWALSNTIKSVEATQKMVELAKARDSTTIKQTQDLNKPYLQCTGFYITSFEEGKPIQARFQIVNYGSYTAKVESINIMAHYYQPFPTDTIFKYINDSTVSKGDFLVNKENPYIQYFTAKKVVIKAAVDAVNYSGFVPVVWGEVIYSDEFTGHRKKMLFAATINLPPSQGYILFINKTIDFVKEKK